MKKTYKIIYIFIYIITWHIYVHMAGTVEETIQRCSAFSPSHMDFRLKMTAWGNGARNTKIIYNYKWQSRSLGARESRDPALSIPSSPTFSYPICMTVWKLDGQSGEKYGHTSSPHVPYQQVYQSVSLAQMFGISEFVVRRQERITESCSFEQLILTLALFVLTSRLHSLRFRPSWW